MLALVHQVAVDGGDGLLDLQLLAGEDELLELAVGGEQHLRRRRLEGDPPLDAEDRVAEVDAAADAEARRRGFDRLDQGDRRELAGRPSAAGTPASKRTVWRSARSGASKAPRDSTQALSGSGRSLPSVSRPPIVTPQRPRLTE